MSVIRCPWCSDDPLYVDYHDREWGVPLHDDRRLFEFLVLEGAQAGLSWITVLRKRENYRRAFACFAIDKIAGYGEDDVERLMGDPGIVRNRLKIVATIANARACLQVQAEFGSLDAYLWTFVEGRPIRNAWQEMSEVPAKTPLAETISKDLSRRGFKFVGPTICYAFMQAVGMVNDHLVSCRRYTELA